MSETRHLIQPVLIETYGEGAMVYAFANHLAQQIDGQQWDSRGREYMIMLSCWDWFSGGDTAQNVAERIEAVLP